MFSLTKPKPLPTAPREQGLVTIMHQSCCGW